MADAGRSGALQPAHSLNYVKFGHFGVATYDRQTQRWHFLRQSPPSDNHINGYRPRPSPFRLVQQPNRTTGNESTLLGSTASSSRIIHGALLRDVPDAASGLIECEDVKMTARPQPEISDSTLLAFGSALILGRDDIRSGLQTTPIAAYTTKEEPAKVILAHMDQQTGDTDLEENLKVRVPCISKGGTTAFPVERGQILQLRFSERSSRQDATWLAVRSAAATSVYQPLIHRAAAIYSQEALLDPNFVVEVPISHTGGFHHADVVFHPENPREFALVDVAGNWSIWKINGKRSHTAHSLYHAQLIDHGFLALGIEKHDQLDGWHRLLWSSTNGQDIDCLLVANRQRIALFDLDGSLMIDVNVRIGLKGQCWLLDLKPGKVPGQFLVLSTSQVLIMTVSSPPMGTTRAEIKVDALWDHFRAHNDSSLELHVLRFDNTMWLFLTSARNPLITAWLVQDQYIDDSVHGSVSDPFTLEPPEINSETHYLAIQGVTTELKVKSEESHDSGCSFKCFMTNGHGEITEALYQISGMGRSLSAMVNPIPNSQKSLLTHRTSHRVDEYEDEADLVDFVVADSDTNEPPNVINYSDEVSRSGSSKHSAQTASGSHCPRLCDLQRTYESISTQFASLGSHERRSSIGDLLDTVSLSINDLSKAKTIFQLLFDQSADSTRIAEIETDSSRLDHWIQELGHPKTVCSGSTLWESGSLINLYDEVVDSWMSSLSNSIPDRARVHRERLIRQVALEFYLSSTVIKPTMESDRLVPDGSLGQSSSLMSDYSLPTGPLEGELPTSPVVASSYHADLSPPRFSVLSQYCSYKKRPGLSSNMSASLESVLGHLPVSPDVNPEEYSFSDTELNLALARSELANLALDPKARKKAEKLARARKKQLDKQTQIKKVAFEQMNILPSVMSSQLPIRGPQSSQARPLDSSQPSIDIMPRVSMTQPERGAYGQRDVKKTKKQGKIRQKGF